MAFRNNINALHGKTKTTEIDAWNELAKLYDFAIKSTKKAYMPNSKRQEQYLAISQEISQSNDNLLLRVRFLVTKAQADQIASAMQRFQHRVKAASKRGQSSLLGLPSGSRLGEAKENATASYINWREKSHYASGQKTIEK